MKEKITYLILGILIGAVITAGAFLVFSKTNTGGVRGEMPEDFDANMVGEMRENGEMKGGRGNENEVAPENMELPTNTDESTEGLETEE